MNMPGKKIKYQTPTDLCRLIQQICARPRMYVCTNDSESVLAFIGGCDYAFSGSKPDEANPKILFEFSCWLAEKIGKPGKWAWMDILNRVFPSADEALLHLPLLYEEFKTDADRDTSGPELVPNNIIAEAVESRGADFYDAKMKLPDKSRKIQTNANLGDLIRQVCARPAVYFGITNLNLVLAFIGGFHCALSYCRPDETKSREINEFSIWLAERFGKPRNWAWCPTLIQVFPDVKQALEQLPRLYDEFKADADRDHPIGLLLG